MVRMWQLRTRARPGRRRRAAVLAVAVLTVAGCGGDDQTSTAPSDRPTTAPQATGTGSATSPQARPVAVVSGLDTPVQVVPLPGDGARLWVVEQRGVVRSVRGGVLDEQPVVDLSGSTTSGGEQGLLSLALHPNFPTTDLAYLHRSDRDGDTLVTEHRVDAGRIVPDPTRVLLEVDQPFANHNGGTLTFGPDGLLYLGLGDGGAAADPQGNGQNLDSKLGKLLRMDLNAPGSWEVAAFGLRNPWRFSFDPPTGAAWIGDVGQGEWEEIDVFRKGDTLTNFGWSVREGRHAFSNGGNDAINGAAPAVDPVAEYSHDEGCSVTGGVVVRNPALPDLDGRYLYADYCAGTFWSIPAERFAAGASPRKERFAVDSPVSIDAAADGSVYVTSHKGTIYRLTADDA